MARYVLDVQSTTGDRLPGCTSNRTSVAVYDEADLAERLQGANDRDDVTVAVRDLDRR